MTAITVDAMPSITTPETPRRIAKPTARQLEIAAAPSSATEHAAAMRAFFAAVLPPILGLLLVIGVWHVATIKGGAIPSPAKTWDAATLLFADPFYRNGPNDQGIGWNILASLQRVGIGFGIAALVGIPAGFLLGRFALLSSLVNPLISLLRPVSPLAWLPIGLLVFKRADPAATWTIFICSIWPMIMNTAQGVQRVFLSMGADGILAGTREELVHLPCLPTCMVNTTGGGDAVMAALVWAYLQGLDLRESAAAALRAGKATVEYPGTNNPDLGALVHG